jgi:Domain of unknown function (DUF2804), C-terminal
MPLRMIHGGRPLKRWRYVGLFGEQLMACAALVQVGPARQSFWALYERGERRLRQRTRLLPRRAALWLSPGLPGRRERGSRPEPGRVRLRDGGVELDLRLEEEEGIQAVCTHGGGLVWTRKQAGVAARGTLALDDGRARELTALAVIDDTAGYHARHTEWWWAAGVGESTDGSATAWNLVRGVNDPPAGSERAVWVAGKPHEAAPVRFAADLSSISCEDGSSLCFRAEAERSRRENLLIVSSDYRAPFGSFSGTLPGGIPLAHGRGVCEHHRARW